MKLKVSRVLHAGYIFEYNGTKILFDPIFEKPFSRNCYAFPDIDFDYEQIKKLKPRAVFISHIHDDHCSLESLNLLNKSTPIYIYCVFDEIISLIKDLGFSEVHSLKLNKTIHINEFEIKPCKALDEDIDSIYHIRVAGLNILNVVDSWIDDETFSDLENQDRWDLVLWPFQTMREIEVLAPTRALKSPVELPKEWIEQLKKLKPRYIIPSSCQFIHESWSWYNQALFPITYKYFEKIINIATPVSQIIRLNPSCTFDINLVSLNNSASLSWITPLGDQDVDYDYQPDLIPPKTSEIAKKFQALTVQQTARVFNYCGSELLGKYHSLEAPQDPYFNKPRLWKLSVYDHLGAAFDFYYTVHRGQIKKNSVSSLNFQWYTEIPISKFYAALELGESLTSMYIRINDILFNQQVEAEIIDVDIMDDPLIRCLFTGCIGTYQIAQLKKIKNLDTNYN
jgi:Beta-lactamase superfamily domain